MKATMTACMLTVAALLVPSIVFAQAPRDDVIWARTTAGAPITLDGVLNEAAWAKAESVLVRWSENSGNPGSGWKLEAGCCLPSDPTYAVLKLLVVGNQMYLGATVRDSSIGGGADFNRFDGFLMAIKDHTASGFPKPPAEHLYSWWYPDNANPQSVGKLPSFIGKWATWPPGTPRDSTQIANWDAVTVVNGITNSDTLPDTRYTVEMRFNLAGEGYDVTDADGDVVEWNISVYDGDWFWPVNATKVSGNRVWWQGPWGNALTYNEVRVYSRPDVTINSGPVPVVGPELRIRSGATYPFPVIDGLLSEAVWADMPKFDIRWNDAALRATYPGVGPFRSGQFQPVVNGGTAAILDSADATVTMFHRGDSLYLGFDVRDQVVQYHPFFDRWDGFIVGINERTTLSADSNLATRRLSFQVGPGGSVLKKDYTSTLIDTLGGGRLALALKPGTTVDTLGQQADAGYTAEFLIDLTKLSYPPGLGDRSLWLGINLLDGDSFIPITDSYGTRTWWFREYDNSCCPVWAYLDPTPFGTAVGDPPSVLPLEIRLVDSRPNPFREETTIRYVLTEPGHVTLEVFDVQGRLVVRDALGAQTAGVQVARFAGSGRNAGVYFYKLKVADREGGAERASYTGRLTLVR